MGRRTIVLFYGAVAAAVFFLGSAWSAAGRATSAPSVAVLVVSVLGFLATAFVAGRIVFVVGRFRRRARDRSGGSRSG